MDYKYLLSQREWRYFFIPEKYLKKATSSPDKTQRLRIVRSEGLLLGSSPLYLQKTGLSLIFICLICKRIERGSLYVVGLPHQRNAYGRY